MARNTRKAKSKDLPVLTVQCGTCPFKDGSPYDYLREHLTESCKTESRICHSTSTSAIYGRTGKPSAICRGARDIQLRHWFSIGFIEAPTDEAWAKKLREVRALLET